MFINFFIAMLMVFFFSACTAPMPTKGTLGYASTRNIVIVGENVETSIAEYYQKKYDALVWFTPFKGDVAHFTNNVVESGIGPSRGMRGLMVQLKSINGTVGRWNIYVPKIAEKYVIRTFKHMGAGALAKARGSLIFIDSSYGPDVEKEVQRVSDGNFFVEFDKGKD